MTKNYYLGIDQSTQGTKAVLFNREGKIVCRRDRAHTQFVNDKGWVGHDLEEIYGNTVGVAGDVIEAAGIDAGEIAGIGISNQRETSAAFDRKTGRPAAKAIVWQCSRAEEVCLKIRREHPEADKIVQERSGIPISPYFPAAKYAWFLENVPEVRKLATEGNLALGTIDTWLVYKLTGGKEFRTDYSNASRTELFNIRTLSWDEDLLAIFGIHKEFLPTVTDSDACFGETDLEGLLPEQVPIHGVLGDSHAALFGQGCFEPGQTKSTYGTGSSVMMNIGEKPVFSDRGIVTSLAWKADGKAQYVLEGNINYSGAVITWLKDDVRLIGSAGETGDLAMNANPEDTTYLIPGFSGLGAPYWEPRAKAILCGMTRVTGRNEIVRAALDSIAYQITDIAQLMNETSSVKITELRVDGGPTRNHYLMQKQSDTLQLPVIVPETEELSAIGAAFAGGIAQGFFDIEQLFADRKKTIYRPEMDPEKNAKLREGWKEALKLATGK